MIGLWIEPRVPDLKSFTIDAHPLPACRCNPRSFDLPSYFDQDFGLRNSSPTKKDRGFNTPVLLLPRRSPLVWVGVWSQAAPYSRARLLRAALLWTGFAVDELIPCVTDA